MTAPVPPPSGAGRRRTGSRPWQRGDLPALSCAAVLGEVAAAVLLRGVDGLGRQAGSAALVVGAVLLVAWRRGPAWDQLGLRRPGRRDVVSALLVAVGVVGAQVGLGLALGLRPAVAIPPWSAVLDVAVVTPLEEELVFRGVVFAGLRARWGGGVAAAASALVFGLVHLPAVVLPTVLGVVLAVLFARTGSLWPGVLVHALNNAVALATGTPLPVPPDLVP